jgi:hypothetical protein
MLCHETLAAVWLQEPARVRYHPLPQEALLAKRTTDDCSEGHPGDSAAQRECETHILRAVEKEVGCPLTKRRVPLPNGGLLEVDGCSEGSTVLCEAWAHQGRVRPAQKSKVVTDAAKLFLAGQIVGGNPRLVLAFADEVPAMWFKGKSWMAALVATMGIDVIVVDIPAQVRDKVLAAQARQHR